MTAVCTAHTALSRRETLLALCSQLLPTPGSLRAPPREREGAPWLVLATMR